MLNKSVARRYAEAFFSIAQEQDKIDDFQQELELVTRTIDEVENLKEYLAHLLIPAKDKKEIMGKIIAGMLSPVTLNFIFMIIDKRREAYIGVIVEEYKEMADEFRDITKAELIAAKEVPQEEVQALAKKLSAATGKTVQIKQTVKPSLLGGVMIRIGDQIIDGTVAKKLEMLKQQLLQVKIS